MDLSKRNLSNCTVGILFEYSVFSSEKSSVSDTTTTESLKDCPEFSFPVFRGDKKTTQFLTGSFLLNNELDTRLTFRNFRSTDFEPVLKSLTIFSRYGIRFRITFVFFNFLTFFVLLIRPFFFLLVILDDWLTLRLLRSKVPLFAELDLVDEFKSSNFEYREFMGVELAVETLKLLDLSFVLLFFLDSPWELVRLSELRFVDGFKMESLFSKIPINYFFYKTVSRNFHQTEANDKNIL